MYLLNVKLLTSKQGSVRHHPHFHWWNVSCTLWSTLSIYEHLQQTLFFTYCSWFGIRKDYGWKRETVDIPLAESRELTTKNCPSPLQLILTDLSSQRPAGFTGSAFLRAASFPSEPWNCVSFFPHPTVMNCAVKIRAQNQFQQFSHRNVHVIVGLWESDCEIDDKSKQSYLLQIPLGPEALLWEDRTPLSWWLVYLHLFT